MPKLQDRIEAASLEHRICAIPGCANLTMRSAAMGLAEFHCRNHVEHKARHGSHWHATYSATELKPYIRAASSYLGYMAIKDVEIRQALDQLDRLLLDAGPAEIASRLKGLPTPRKARIALARLREAEVKPERILAVVLAVTALIEEDPGSHRTQEFRIVQIAKAIHRLASGYHRVWEFEDHQGRTRRTELHAYSRSSGPMLRMLGKSINEPCEWAVEKHLGEILALKIKRYGHHPAKPLATV